MFRPKIFTEIRVGLGCGAGGAHTETWREWNADWPRIRRRLSALRGRIGSPYTRAMVTFKRATYRHPSVLTDAHRAWVVEYEREFERLAKEGWFGRVQRTDELHGEASAPVHLLPPEGSDGCSGDRDMERRPQRFPGRTRR